MAVCAADVEAIPPDAVAATMTGAFTAWISFLSRWEGHESDDPHDRGGRTVYGISSAAHPDVDLDRLTPAGVAKIARESYWQPCGGDALPPRVAVALADYAWHSSVETAVRDLQRCVGALPDGRVGPLTIAAVRAADRDLALALALNERRRVRLRAIGARPGQARFLDGWLNRVDALDELVGLAENVGGGGA